MDTPTLSYDELLASIQQLAPEDQTRLLEDLEGIAFARDYETRRATGERTPDELDVLPFDEAIVEIECERAALPHVRRVGPDVAAVTEGKPGVR